MDEWSDGYAISNVPRPDGRLNRLIRATFHKLIKCRIYFENKKHEKPCPYNKQVMCVQYPAEGGVDDMACDGCENKHNNSQST